MIYDFDKYIPLFYNRDSKLQSFVDVHNSLINSVLTEIIDLSYLRDPARIPQAILKEVGNLLSAGILPSDSERTKRQKIYNAIQTHKYRGTWANDVKITIDSIVGGDSKLFGGFDNSDFILMAGESIDPDYYWATLGVDGIDLDLGIDLVSGESETVITGVFEIDVDSNSLTSEEVENLKFALIDKIPVYFIVFLGYDNGGFVQYPNGRIN